MEKKKKKREKNQIRKNETLKKRNKQRTIEGKKEEINRERKKLKLKWKNIREIRNDVNWK